MSMTTKARVVIKTLLEGEGAEEEEVVGYFLEVKEPRHCCLRDKFISWARLILDEEFMVMRIGQLELLLLLLLCNWSVVVVWC